MNQKSGCFTAILCLAVEEVIVVSGCLKHHVNSCIMLPYICTDTYTISDQYAVTYPKNDIDEDHQQLCKLSSTRQPHVAGCCSFQVASSNEYSTVTQSKEGAAVYVRLCV